VRTRLIIAIVVVLVLIGSLAWAARKVQIAVRSLIAYASSERGDWERVGEEERNFDASGARRLVIENPVGDIEIVPGGPGMSIHAAKYSRATYGGTGASGRVGVSCHSDGKGGLKVTTSATKDHTRVDLALKVPVALDVTVSLTVGSVSIERIAGSVTVDSRAGEITVKDCAGPVRVHTTVGSVEVADAGGDVTATTGAGDVSVTGARGRVYGHSGTGQVTLDRIISDDVTATAGCGDVEVAMGAPFTGAMRARTRIGTATVALRPGSRCRISTSVGIGEVSDDVPASVVARSGPGLVEVSSRVGEVTVTEAR